MQFDDLGQMEKMFSKMGGAGNRKKGGSRRKRGGSGMSGGMSMSQMNKMYD